MTNPVSIRTVQGENPLSLDARLKCACHEQTMYVDVFTEVLILGETDIRLFCLLCLHQVTRPTRENVWWRRLFYAVTLTSIYCYFVLGDLPLTRAMTVECLQFIYVLTLFPQVAKGCALLFCPLASMVTGTQLFCATLASVCESVTGSGV